VKKELSTTRK